MKLSLSFLSGALALTSTVVLAAPSPANPLKIIELKAREAGGEVLSIPGVNGFRVRTTKKVDLDALGEELFSSLSGKNPWNDHSKCRTRISTRNGANCYNSMLGATVKGRNGIKIEHGSTKDNGWNVCPWTNTDPSIQYFTHQEVGHYSIQFTATDTKAWDGIADTTKCPVEGLCNPRLIIFRDGWDLIIDTWVAWPLGVEESPDGALCYSYVYGHLGGGNGMIHDCVIPCKSQISLHELK